MRTAINGVIALKGGCVDSYWYCDIFLYNLTKQNKKKKSKTKSRTK